jgi:hypothetical protein
VEITGIDALSLEIGQLAAAEGEVSANRMINVDSRTLKKPAAYTFDARNRRRPLLSVS